MDSSDEQFYKKTMRGRYLRALGDDIEDLRREAQAIEIDEGNTGTEDTPSSNAATQSTKSEEDDFVSPAQSPPVANPFGTLRSQRKRNARLLAEIETPDGSENQSKAQSAMESLFKPPRSAPKSPRAPKQPKSKHSVRTNASSSSLKTSSGKTDAGNVANKRNALELQESRSKQQELETKLIQVTQEKKGKEIELEKALAKIKELEVGKSSSARTELDFHRATARNLQTSILSYQQQEVDIDRARMNLAKELMMSFGNQNSSSSSSAQTDSNENPPGNLHENGGDEEDDDDDEEFGMQMAVEETVVDEAALEQARIDAEKAKEERKKRTKKKSTKSLVSTGGVGGVAASPVKIKKEKKNSTSTSPDVSGSPIGSSLAQQSQTPPGSAEKQSLVDKVSKPKRSKSSSISGPGSLSPSGVVVSQPAPTNNLKKIDAVTWFIDNYLACCKSVGSVPIEDLILILKRSVSKLRKLVELDLNTYDITLNDIDSLTRAFIATNTQMSGIRVNIEEIVNSFEPLALDLASNNIASGKPIADLVIATQCVVALDISRTGLGPRGTMDFAQAMKDYSKLSTLKCGSNAMGPKAGSQLLTYLASSCTQLQVLDISDNLLDDRAAGPLGNVIQTCPITNLVIKYNKFKSDGMKKIITSISQNDTLNELDLTQCGLGERSKQLLEIFESRNNIVKLCIGFNKMPSAFIPKWTSFTAQQKALVHVDVRCLNLSSKGMRSVIEALTVNVSDTLQELVLNGNMLDAKCVELLIDYVTRGKVMHSLGLRGCGLPRNPLIELLASIKHSSVLKMVDLSGNKLDDKRILEALAACLSGNKSLTTIGLAATQMDSKTASIVGQSLAFNKTLEKLHFDGNKLGERGLMELGNALNGNETMRVLSIRQTGCTSRTLLSLLASVVANTQIEVIDAGDNGLPVSNKQFRERVNQFDAVAVKF